MKLKGKVIKILANFYYVIDAENKIWECFARKRIQKEGKKIFVGDELEFEVSSPLQGVITNVFERKNFLNRPQSSNIDEVLVVFSTCEPGLDLYNLDRYLAYIEYSLPGVEISICLNKIDLKEEKIDKIYQPAGYKIFYVSAIKSIGIDELAQHLLDKNTLFAGPSGVGKSSLIKALSPNIDIRIGEMSAIKQGTHTTRNIELIPYLFNNKVGFVFDTPGFSNIDFQGIDLSFIKKSFKELSKIKCGFNNCLFDSCSHDGKNSCLIENPNDFLNVFESRFNSYLNILEEAREEVIYKHKKEDQIKNIGGLNRKIIPKIEKKKKEKSRKKHKQELLKDINIFSNDDLEF